MDDQRIELMKNAPVSKAVNHMGIPATIGLLTIAVYNFVDTIFVAWLGTEATGATQVVLPIMMLLSAFGLAIGMGSGSYVSRLLGMNDREHANEVGSVAIFTAIGFGLLVTVVSLSFLTPILVFFGAAEDVLIQSTLYGRYILMGGTFSICNMTLNNLLRSEGSARLSMVGQLTGSVVNMILDPLFIFGFGLGIEGAAIATVLSQMVTFSILISRYLNHHSVLRLSPRYFRPSRRLYGEIFKVGIPTFFRQMLFSVSIGLLNQAAMTYGGDALLAAAGLVYKTIAIPNYAIFGFGQGFQPVAGYNYGAGNRERVMGAFTYTLKICMAVGGTAALLYLLLDEQILSIFKPAAEVLAYSSLAFRFYAPTMVLMAVSNTIGVFYQALGKGKASLLLSVARQGLFFIPALLILSPLLGVYGVLMSQLIADGLTVAISLAMFLPYVRSGRMAGDMSGGIREKFTPIGGNNA